MGHTHLPEPNDLRYREVRKVTLIGAFVDLVLGVAKIIVGTIAGSQALVADGVHSLSDLATDFLVLFAAKHAHRAADEDHPYGHGRIETVATVVLGVALIVVAIGITLDSAHRLMREDDLVVPGVLALVVAVLSVLSKEAIYQYTARVARRLNSKMLLANAWHSRTDAISSIVVIIGVVGAMLGYPWLDSVAAIAVALMIAKIGWDLLWQSLQELIDTALDPEQVEQIRAVIMSVDGVRSCHMLRTRHSGSDSLVDVHIQVDPMLSVSEGHQIGEVVRKQLQLNIDHIVDVTVHIDPEDDELAKPCDALPLRDEILARLHAEWAEVPLTDRLDRVVLHYLDGQVHVDLFVSMDGLADGEQARLRDQLVESARRASEIGSVEVFHR